MESEAGEAQYTEREEQRGDCETVLHGFVSATL